ncbi:hypothetical protein ASZ90_018461 [hydrocarbon metagenome]|uniref:Oxaloacetate decarboxylase, gamma chain n=1 Tax=hydrocarbon metagenome TaxID=938273 RepID=A0A0W8E6T2_9ZZZZ
MTLVDSLMVSLIGFAIVFFVLIVLSVFIQLQTVVLGYATATKGTDIRNVPTGAEKAFTAEVPEIVAEGWSAGELKLLGVDEKTAAMIMAIVSHESQIPLSELQFKMIKAID